MQLVWLMTMFIFTVVFFLVFFTIYFFRPRKEDKIIPVKLERELVDPEEISLPHRAEPDWAASFETADGKTDEARIISISHGSAFMTSNTSLNIGEKFQLVIHLPERPPLQLKAEVTWSNMLLPPEKVVRRGMGIRFIEAGEDAVCLINATIGHHAATLKGMAEPAAD
jgi:Tfp pilus assembly protein PilZ